MPFFDGIDGRVFHRHWAQVENPRAAVVFLHGFGEHSGLYHRYASALAGHGIDLWALDEVGHGLTDGERGHFGTIDGLVENGARLGRLAAREQPGLPLVVAGHSLGSLVAVRLAVEQPVPFAGAVVSGAPLSPLPWLQDTGGTDEPFELDLDDLSADPFYRDELVNDPLAFTGADVGALLGAAFPPAWEWVDRELPGIGVPVLAVHGAQDGIAPIEGVRRWIDRAPALRLVEIAGAAHDVLNEVAHARVADTVAEFVLEVSATSAGAAG